MWVHPLLPANEISSRSAVSAAGAPSTDCRASRASASSAAARSCHCSATAAPRCADTSPPWSRSKRPANMPYSEPFASSSSIFASVPCRAATAGCASSASRDSGSSATPRRSSRATSSCASRSARRMDPWRARTSASHAASYESVQPPASSRAAMLPHPLLRTPPVAPKESSSRSAVSAAAASATGRRAPASRRTREAKEELDSAVPSRRSPAASFLSRTDLTYSD